jgi:hypothetical protein
VPGSEARIVTGNYSSRVFDLEKLVKDRSCSCPSFVLHSLYGWGSSIQFDGVLLAAIADQDERSVRALLGFLSRESTGVHRDFARLTPFAASRSIVLPSLELLRRSSIGWPATASRPSDCGA